MLFTGTGSVWNPKKNRILVDFNKVEEFETNDKEEIEILCSVLNIEREAEPDIYSENLDGKELTKPEVLELLKHRNIKHNPRDKKEVLIKLLEE